MTEYMIKFFKMKEPISASFCLAVLFLIFSKPATPPLTIPSNHFAVLTVALVFSQAQLYIYMYYITACSFLKYSGHLSNLMCVCFRNHFLKDDEVFTYLDLVFRDVRERTNRDHQKLPLTATHFS